jgi:hypothetical protein
MQSVLTFESSPPFMLNSTLVLLHRYRHVIGFTGFVCHACTLGERRYLYEQSEIIAAYAP